MAATIDRWPSLRRSTPDSTISTPSYPARVLLNIYGYSRIFLSILFTFPVLIARHYLFGPPLLPWMPLITLLLTRYVKLLGNYLRIRPPVIDPEEWVIPTVPWKLMVEGRRGEVVDIVRLAPVGKEWRQGIAVCEGIEGVERPGLMLTPPGAVGKGLEQAKEGERVILY